MANKPTKPVMLPPRPLSEEEKKMKTLQFLANQRAQFSINILANLVRGSVNNADLDSKDYLAMVDLSVDMADKLLDRLYTTNEEEK